MPYELLIGEDILDEWDFGDLTPVEAVQDVFNAMQEDAAADLTRPLLLVDKGNHTISLNILDAYPIGIMAFMKLSDVLTPDPSADDERECLEDLRDLLRQKADDIDAMIKSRLSVSL